MSISDEVYIPTELLRQVSGDLQEMSGQLSAKNNAIKLLDGEDSIHGHKIKAAVQKFYDAWSEPRRDEEQNLQRLGELTNDIADKTLNLDHAIEEMFKAIEIPSGILLGDD